MSESGGSPGKDGGPTEDFYEPQRFLLKGHAIVLRLRDLTVLYGVPTKALKQAVKRNPEKFPGDFVFQLTLEETETVQRSRSQIVTMKRARRHYGSERTQQSPRRRDECFRRPRLYPDAHRTHGYRELAHKLAELERRIGGHDESIRTLFDAIRHLMTPPEKARRSIGFRVEEARPAYAI